MSHDFRDKNSVIPEFVPATNRWQRAGETLGSRLRYGETSIFAWKTACQMYFFSDPFPKKTLGFLTRIMNLTKTGFRFDLKNPLEVWILWIHDPFLDFSNKKKNPFSDSRIRIWIFPKKRTQMSGLIWLPIISDRIVWTKNPWNPRHVAPLMRDDFWYRRAQLLLQTSICLFSYPYRL